MEELAGEVFCDGFYVGSMMACLPDQVLWVIFGGYLCGGSYLVTQPQVDFSKPFVDWQSHI